MPDETNLTDNELNFDAEDFNVSEFDGSDVVSDDLDNGENEQTNSAENGNDVIPRDSETGPEPGQPAGNGESGHNGEVFTVKYNGKEQTLSRDEMVTNAQKGMNYDHIYAELQDARAVIRGQLLGGRETDVGENIPMTSASEIHAPADTTMAVERIFFENPELKALPEAAARAALNGEDPYLAFWRDQSDFYRNQALAAVAAERARVTAFPALDGDAPGEEPERDEFLKGFV